MRAGGGLAVDEQPTDDEVRVGLACVGVVWCEQVLGSFWVLLLWGLLGVLLYLFGVGGGLVVWCVFACLCVWVCVGGGLLLGDGMRDGVRMKSCGLFCGCGGV